MLDSDWLSSNREGRRIIVSDCTLREGEQQPGIVLDRDAKVQIAYELSKMGIKRAEIGTPAISAGERESIRKITEAGILEQSLGVCRAVKADLDLAAECGLWGVVISSPVSPYQLQDKLKWSLPKMIESAVECHRYAHSLGLKTFASAYDTFRTPWIAVEKLYRTLLAEGSLSGIRVVDTVGVATPAATAKLVSNLRASFSVEIEVHMHDDFGLALANAVAAVEAGADSVSSSIAGVGERAGNIATEEVVAALHFALGFETGLDIRELGPRSRRIASLLSIDVQPNRAISGKNAFRHVSGLSVGGFLRNPLVAQPIHAECIGLESQVVLGKVSGSAAVRYHLGLLGLEVPEEDIPELLRRVKLLSEETRSLVTDDQFREVVASLM